MTMGEKMKHKCAYCGKEKLEEEMILHEIVFRDINPITRKAFINTKKNWYCKGTGCAGYDQMAHEG